MMKVLHLFQEPQVQRFISLGGGEGLGENSIQKGSVDAGRREREKVERKLPQSLRSFPKGVMQQVAPCPGKWSHLKTPLS